MNDTELIIGAGIIIQMCTFLIVILCRYGGTNKTRISKPLLCSKCGKPCKEMGIFVEKTMPIMTPEECTPSKLGAGIVVELDNNKNCVECKSTCSVRKKIV